jgi:hypothetical protein
LIVIQNTTQISAFIPSVLALWCLQCTFLKERVKVDGKTGNLGDKVEITDEGNNINVTAELPFSKRCVPTAQCTFVAKKRTPPRTPPWSASHHHDSRNWHLAGLEFPRTLCVPWRYFFAYAE